MATLKIITPNLTTTKTPTNDKATALLDGFAKYNDYTNRKLANETKEEFFHRIMWETAINQAKAGSFDLDREARLAQITPAFTGQDI